MNPRVAGLRGRDGERVQRRRPIRAGCLEFSFRGKLEGRAGVEGSTCVGSYSEGGGGAGDCGEFEDNLVGRSPWRGASLDAHVEGGKTGVQIFVK